MASPIEYLAELLNQPPDHHLLLERLYLLPKDFAPRNSGDAAHFPISILQQPCSPRIPCFATRPPTTSVKMSGLATKQQSQKLFEKLKAKQANKVMQDTLTLDGLLANTMHARSALTAAPKTRHGRRCPLASTYVWIVPLTTETLVSISPLFDPPTSTVRIMRFPPN